jgi:hypothetical protein
MEKKYWRYQNSIDNSVLTNKDIAKNQLEQIIAYHASH